MNQWTNLYAPLLGRILLGGFFLWSGIQKTLNFPAFIDFFTRPGYPYPLFLALTVIVVEILFGIALIVDIKTRLSAIVLAIYMVTISLLFSKIATTVDVQIFLQNMAIVGGLLTISGYGTSRWTPSWQR